MGNFNRRDDRGGDRGGFKPRRDVTMHRATCSNCGQSCEVPFRPTGDKPVYCNNCFGKMRNAEGGAGSGKDKFQRRDFGGAPQRQNFEGNKQGGNADIVHQLEALNGKLDRILRTLEKPASAAAPIAAKPGTLKQAVKNAVNQKKKK